MRSIFEFIASLNLSEKLSPIRNKEIIWFYIFLPSAVLYLSFLARYLNEKPALGSILVLDASFQKLIPKSAKIEIIATGSSWTDGPLWMQDDSLPFFLYTDTAQNRIYKWEEGKGMFTIGKTIYVEESGCRSDPEYCRRIDEPGAAGLVRRNEDSQDIIACSHGERSIMLLRENGTRSVVASHYKGSRLNSPNDLIWSPEGHLYFTDPPFGLYGIDGSVAGKELNHSGVYMIKSEYLKMALDMGVPTAYVRLLESKLSLPNGLALSPDFSKMYITNSEPSEPSVWVYDVADDGSIANGRLFFNATELFLSTKTTEVATNLPRHAAFVTLNGLKVDIHGNLYVAGIDGVFVISSQGKLVGRLIMDRPVSNVAFGGDGRLYITAGDIVARVKVTTKPARIIKRPKV